MPKNWLVGVRLNAAMLAIGVCVLAVPATAGEFRGGGFIANFEGCVGPDAPSGVIPVQAVYAPAELTGNEVSNLTVLNGPRGLALNLRMTSGAFLSSATRGRSTILDPTPNLLRPHPSIRVLGQQPSAINDSSSELRLRMRVQNFSGFRSCTADIELQLMRG